MNVMMMCANYFISYVNQQYNSGRIDNEDGVYVAQAKGVYLGIATKIRKNESYDLGFVPDSNFLGALKHTVGHMTDIKPYSEIFDYIFKYYKPRGVDSNISVGNDNLEVTKEQEDALSNDFAGDTMHVVKLKIVDN